MEIKVQRPQAPDPSAKTPNPVIEILENATVLPSAPGTTMVNGVVRFDGSICDLSRTQFSNGQLSNPPVPLTDTSDLPFLKGRYLYAGIGRHHFGHFILETLPRLWALDEQQPPFDGLLIIPKEDIDFGAVLKRRYAAFLNVLTDALPVHLIETPHLVEHLIVPTQGIGHKTWIEGTAQFRRFMRKHLERNITPDGPEKLYISRSKLKREDQMVDQEIWIEQVMRDAGYVIFHPQKHSVEVQCQRYMAAQKIVGSDGSSFHLAPFVMQPDTHVALFQRRWRQDVVDALARQISTCSKVQLTRINPLVSPTDMNGEVPTLNLDLLLQSLKAAGFL